MDSSPKQAHGLVVRQHRPKSNVTSNEKKTKQKMKPKQPLVGLSSNYTKKEVRAFNNFLESSVRQITPPRGVPSKPLSARDIPFFKEAFSRGTQVPTLRLYIASTVCASTTTTLATVVTLSQNSLIEWDQFLPVFTEYRFVKGEVTYVPAAQNTTALPGSVLPAVGVIEYDNNSNGALASYDAALQYDVKKWFVPALVVSHGETGIKVTKWKLEFDFIPDQQWYFVSSTPDVVAYWKCFASLNAVNATQCGIVSGWMDIQFRGLGGV